MLSENRCPSLKKKWSHSLIQFRYSPSSRLPPNPPPIYMAEFLESVASLAVSLYSPDEFTQECCGQSPMGITSTLLSKLRVASVPVCILVRRGPSGTNIKLSTVRRNSARGSEDSVLPGSSKAHLSLPFRFQAHLVSS